MNTEQKEPFREWELNSSEKGLFLLPYSYVIQGVPGGVERSLRSVQQATGKIMRDSERDAFQFKLELRSPVASWLNLKQLHEPGKEGIKPALSRVHLYK